MTYRESTLSDFIDSYNETDITFSSLHYKEKDQVSLNSNLILLSTSLIDKYKNELDDHITKVTLTNQEFNKYQFNPKLLSFDVYGSTELWALILDLNQLHSTTEFNINPIKMYDTSIIQYINAILNLEKPFTDINTSEIGD